MRVSFPVRRIIDSFFISDMKRKMWKMVMGGVLSCTLCRRHKWEGASQTEKGHTVTVLDQSLAQDVLLLGCTSRYCRHVTNKLYWIFKLLLWDLIRGNAVQRKMQMIILLASNEAFLKLQALYFTPTVAVLALSFSAFPFAHDIRSWSLW